MYQILKHLSTGTPVILLNTTCESMARVRFEKSSALLRAKETIELWHDGVLVSYAQAPDKTLVMDGDV